MIHKYWNPVFTTFSAHCWAVHHLMLLVLRGNWCLKVCWLKEPLYCKRFSVFIWQPQASMGPFSSLCVADVYNDNENNLILVSIKLRILEFLILLGEQKDLSMSTKRTWCVCVCCFPSVLEITSHGFAFIRAWPFHETMTGWDETLRCHRWLCFTGSFAASLSGKERKKKKKQQWKATQGFV